MTWICKRKEWFTALETGDYVLPWPLKHPFKKWICLFQEISHPKIHRTTVKNTNIRNCDSDSSIVITESWYQLKPICTSWKSIHFNYSWWFPSSSFFCDHLLQTFWVCWYNTLQREIKVTTENSMNKYISQSLMNI